MESIINIILVQITENLHLSTKLGVSLAFFILSP